MFRWFSINSYWKQYLSVLEKQPFSFNALYAINKFLHEVTTFIQFLSIRYADQVFVGNEVLIERNDQVMPIKVIDVSSLLLQGNKCTNCLLFTSIYITLLYSIKCLNNELYCLIIIINWKKQEFREKNNYLLSRCLCSPDKWRQHHSWWSFSFLSCICWSSLGSLNNSSYKMVF